MKFIEKAQKVSTEPKEFFSEIKNEFDYKELIIYYFLMQSIIFPIAVLTSMFLGVEGNFFVNIGIYIVGLIISAIIFFLILLLYNFIFKFFGGTKGLMRTSQVFVYGLTPSILLSWIPFVNIAATVYSIYIVIIGLIELQEMETWKAIVAYFTPIALAFVIALVFFLLDLTIL